MKRRGDARTSFIDFTFILLAVFAILISIGYYGAVGESLSEGFETGVRTGDAGVEEFFALSEQEPVPLTELAARERLEATYEPEALEEPEPEISALTRLLEAEQRRVGELEAQVQRLEARIEARTARPETAGPGPGPGPEPEPELGAGPEPETNQGEIGRHGILDLRPREDQ